MGQYVVPYQISISQINFDLIEIIKLGGWVGHCVGQWVGSSQITKNSINRNLIEIIRFCLMIYDL